MLAAFPKIRIVTAWVDEGLNEQKFIIPGLGDFGSFLASINVSIWEFY